MESTLRIKRHTGMAPSTNSQKTLEFLNDVARKAGRGGQPGIVFKSVLGAGSHGVVLAAQVLKGSLPNGSTKCSSLMSYDIKPAVKVTEGGRKKLKVAEREYELAKWASSHKLGPAVYCSALWSTAAGERHLIFMEHLSGTLEDLTEWSKSLTSEVKEQQRYAWSLAFLQTQSVSRQRLMGADLKPNNFLVKFSDHKVAGVYITDWDDTYWFLASDVNSALLYNFFSLTVNSMFITSTRYDLSKQWLEDACQFASQMIDVWVHTPAFKKFLIKYDKVNVEGPYHYARSFMPKLDTNKKLSPEDRADRFLIAFHDGIEKRWGASMRAAAQRSTGSFAVTRLGNQTFV